MKKLVFKVKHVLRIVDNTMQFLHDPDVLSFIIKGYVPALRYKDEFWYFRSAK
jgi:hypothetical protein